MTAKTAAAKAPSEALLLEIAAKHFHSIRTLETRNSDSLDFHDVAVWSIRDALAAAFAAGQAAGQCPRWWCRRPRAEPPA